ncbi:MAG: hypothetical protein H6943_10205 [Zoogloeaceae bacterium]|nr:hypothetical protein [Zoogloeaceae bacterium]
MKISRIAANLLAAAALTGFLGGSLAHAHDDAYLDTQKAPNGGQLRMAGPFHYELVVVRDSREAKENPVYVYLTDHAGNKVSSAGASGSAIILAGKQKATATLKPDGDNRLRGMAIYSSDPEMKVVVAIIQADKKTEQARFTPLAAMPGMDHKH